MKKRSLAIWIGIMVLSLAACGKKEENTPVQTSSQTQTESQSEKEISLEEIHNAVKEVYGENYLPEMPMEINDVLNISSDLYEEAIAETPMISAHVDTFIAIKAKEGKGEEVEKALTSYRDYLINDSLQYPMNVPKVNASSVLREGDYVFFVMLGQIKDDMAEEEDMLKQAQESNQLAIDAIKKFFE